jgi:hypothetical protein
VTEQPTQLEAPAGDETPIDVADLVNRVTSIDWLYITRRFETTIEEATTNPIILLIVAAWMHGRHDNPAMDYWQNKTPAELKEYLRIPDDEPDVTTEDSKSGGPRSESVASVDMSGDRNSAVGI